MFLEHVRYGKQITLRGNIATSNANRSSRVDLRPTTSNTSDGTGADQRNSLAPPLTDAEAGSAATGGYRRRSTLLSALNAHRMAEASAAERIAALRRFRMESHSGIGQMPADQARRAPLSVRLQDVFRIRTRRASAAPEAQTTDQTTNEGRGRARLDNRRPSPFIGRMAG